MRRGEVFSSFEESSSAAFEFANSFDKVRFPSQCIDRLGLSAHPSLSASVDPVDGELCEIPRYMTDRIIYHADLQTMFKALPDLAPDLDGDPQFALWDAGPGGEENSNLDDFLV